LSKDTQRGLFHYRVKFLLCALLGRAPNPKSNIGTRFARVLSKAKAHGSWNFHEIRYRKSGFSEGGI